jgi:tRNA(Leu) C34 or U34 (ribose-2'-O)-methylase TrmL
VSGERTGASISTASYNQWIFSADRKAGDVNLSEYVSTSVHNYYVVRFEGRELVESSTADVRHMLIAAGEGSDAANPTDAQYDEALKKAEDLLAQWNLPLYGAALSDTAADIRSVALQRSAVAVGNEGKGLSPELLGLCDGHIIIPMAPGSESLNAAVAASIVLWEMAR